MQSFLKNIVEFIGVLRASGVRVSHSESIDAIRALDVVNLLNKDEVRIALSSCLAKNEEDRKVFAAAFDRFFVDVELRAEHIQSIRSDMEQKMQEINETASELKFRDESIELDDTLKEVYAALPENEKQSIREFLYKTTSGKNVGENFKPIVESIVQSKLKSMKNRYSDEASALADLRGSITSEAGIMAGEVKDTIRQENQLLHKNLGKMTEQDIPGVIRLIEAMTERLVKNMARKKKNSSKKARLDFSKTISRSLSTGGVPFTLKYRRKSKRKYKYLVLCDVSASMHRFSGFVLHLISGINLSLFNAECYIFSQEAEHLNLNGFGNALKFEEQIMNSAVWRKGTDMSKALEHIIHEDHTVLNSSVVVLIVSDAKTINQEKTLEYLKKMAMSVKKMIWLNPIPESEWESTQMIERYREVCHMMDCSTLDKLHQAVAAI